MKAREALARMQRDKQESRDSAAQRENMREWRQKQTAHARSRHFEPALARIWRQGAALTLGELALITGGREAGKSTLMAEARRLGLLPDQPKRERARGPNYFCFDEVASVDPQAFERVTSARKHVDPAVLEPDADTAASVRPGEDCAARSGDPG